MRPIILLALALASCGPSAFQQAQERWPAEDDATCRGYGFQPGTPDYGRCRMARDAIHQQQISTYQRQMAVVAAGMNDWYPRPMAPVTCRSVGTITTCQ